MPPHASPEFFQFCRAGGGAHVLPAQCSCVLGAADHWCELVSLLHWVVLCWPRRKNIMVALQEDVLCGVVRCGVVLACCMGLYHGFMGLYHPHLSHTHTYTHTHTHASILAYPAGTGRPHARCTAPWSHCRHWTRSAMRPSGRCATECGNTSRIPTLHHVVL